MMTINTPAGGASGTASPSSQIQVMLVDDSAVVRGFISRILQADPEVSVVASVSNGEMGIFSVEKYHPDIVILDVEMPVMDGITALPKIIAASPGVRVIMCSTLTVRNGEITMKAFELGATECLAKPSNGVEINSAEQFKTDLLRVVKSLGRRTHRPAGSIAPTATSRPVAGATAFTGGQHGALKSKTDFTLKRPLPGEIFRPNLLAIGSSTGGPQALFKVVSSFKDLGVPIILTQHMPPTFTKILAQHITQQTGVQAFEGETGMPVENNKLYVAPGGRHMTFARQNGRIEIVLNDGPPENFCRPSVDPMVRSAIEIWGPKILGVILTGMGSDGLPSMKMLAEKGGRVVAQDQETSVVWGMPGAVATNGICTAVLPLQDIGGFVRQAFGKV